MLNFAFVRSDRQRGVLDHHAASVRNCRLGVPSRPKVENQTSILGALSLPPPRINPSAKMEFIRGVFFGLPVSVGLETSSNVSSHSPGSSSFTVVIGEAMVSR